MACPGVAGAPSLGARLCSWPFRVSTSLVAKGTMIDTFSPESEEIAAPSRTKKRAARKQQQADLELLAKRLVAVPPKRLVELGLPEAVVKSVRGLAVLKRGSALGRQRRLLVSQLQDLETDVLLLEVEHLLGLRNDVGRTYRREAWRTRLLAEGDKALDALLEACPDADRQRLRQVMRAALAEQDANAANEDDAAPTVQRRAKELFKALAELELPAP